MNFKEIDKRFGMWCKRAGEFEIYSPLTMRKFILGIVKEEREKAVREFAEYVKKAMSISDNELLIYKISGFRFYATVDKYLKRKE
jgi:hypothetical protein